MPHSHQLTGHTDKNETEFLELTEIVNQMNSSSSKILTVSVFIMTRKIKLGHV